MHRIVTWILFFWGLMLLFATCKNDIAEPLPIEVESQITHVSVYNGTDGAIDIYVAGGIAPYQYLWSNGETTQDIDSLKAGEYHLLVSDKSGTEYCDTFEVLQPTPDALLIEKTVQNVSAFGMADGSIVITVAGGVPPYVYSWSNGDTLATLTEIGAGTYVLTLSDAIETTITDTTVIVEPEPQPLSLSLTANNVSSFGQADGAIFSTVSGGVPPYFYDWSNGATTPNIEQLGPGTYELTVTDQFGASLSESAVIIEPEPNALILVVDSLVQPSETGTSDGQIYISVSGGYPPYYYQWSNGVQTQNLIDVEAGNYQIKLSDNSGQSVIKTVALSDSVYDYDGNAYSYIKIGRQVWMQQNLRVAQAPNGTRIVSYAYNNDELLTEVYGRLYSWEAAMNGTEMEMAQGICPNGWHIPSDKEFKILEMELGMTRAEADMVNTWRGNGVGTAMKAGGSSGFNVMLSGRRETNGMFRLMGNTEYIWTSTSYEDSYAWRRCFSAYDKTVGRWNTFPKSYGFSVRCVKNAQD